MILAHTRSCCPVARAPLQSFRGLARGFEGGGSTFGVFVSMALCFLQNLCCVITRRLCRRKLPCQLGCLLLQLMDSLSEADL